METHTLHNSIKGFISKLNNIYKLTFILERIAATMFSMKNDIKEKTKALFLTLRFEYTTVELNFEISA